MGVSGLPKQETKRERKRGCGGRGSMAIDQDEERGKWGRRMTGGGGKNKS